MKIRNREELLSGGAIAVREILLAVLEGSLRTLDGYELIRQHVQCDGDVLCIGRLRWDLRQWRRLYVIGAGKAGNAMARALDQVLGRRIHAGLVIVKELESSAHLSRIELVTGGHPLPNQAGQQAAERILRWVDQAGPDDLFISVISGGSSALMSCPVPPITLQDEALVTDQLLRSGARILEINAVRRHISATNGGRLAQRIEARGAQMINLIISDLAGTPPTTDPAEPTAFYGTPVAPDATTLGDARRALRKYDLLERAPPSVTHYLARDDPARETPKAFGPTVRQFVLATCADGCEAAREAGNRLGLPSLVLTTHLEGESRHAGAFLAAVAKEVASNQRPIAPPCLLLASGETTTRVEGDAGRGGPSQELALGFALEVDGWTGMGIAALDTDGSDGPTANAGGIADGRSLARAADVGLDLYQRLQAHDSAAALEATGDAIVTGPTGTNVCDLNVVYISSHKGDSS